MRMLWFVPLVLVDLPVDVVVVLEQQERAGEASGIERALRKLDVRVDGNMCSQARRAVGRNRHERVYVVRPASRRIGSAEPIRVGMIRCNGQLQARASRRAAARARTLRSRVAADAGARRARLELTAQMAVTLARRPDRRGAHCGRGDAQSSWRSSSSKAASRCPARWCRRETRTGHCRSSPSSVLTEEEVLVRNVPAHPRRRGDARDPARDRRAGQLASAPTRSRSAPRTCTRCEIERELAE